MMSHASVTGSRACMQPHRSAAMDTAHRPALADGLPTLLMLAGLPGAGKSRLALALARRLGWFVIDKDLLHSALLTQGADPGVVGALAYAAALALVDDAVRRQARSVILDTAGRQPFILERAQEITA